MCQDKAIDYSDYNLYMLTPMQCSSCKYMANDSATETPAMLEIRGWPNPRWNRLH